MASPLPDPGTCTCDAGGLGERQVSPEEIAEHKSESSCWVLLKGDVWDLTPFLQDHPGGPSAILDFAGKDATSRWESIHPPEVMKQLVPSLRIGAADKWLLAASQAPDKESVSEQLLHSCKMGGSTEVDELLAAKADPNFQGGSGMEAPLHWAARKGIPPMVATLLAASANVDPLDAEGQTPLHLASRNSNHKVLTDLLAANANIDAKDNCGQTALHAAANLGSVRLVKLLLAAGADCTVKDAEGETAAEVASDQGHSAAEDLINEKLA